MDDQEGPWDYKIHIVDWEARIEIAELGPLQTTVNGGWEMGVDLGSVPAGISGEIAIIMEPMSVINGGAYPYMSLDGDTDGNPIRGTIADFNTFIPEALDFRLELWIVSPNGSVSKAKKVSTSNLTSDKACKTCVKDPGTDLNINKKKSGSKDYIGYNVYRDDELIAENIIESTYFDENLLSGTYLYDVKAVYSDGLSESAGPLTVVVGSGVPRDLVIVEVGTGTWCVFCPGAAMGVDEMHAEGLSVGVIEYHSGDAYATTETGLRLNYYGVSSYPTAIFDGVDTHAGGNATNSLYETFLPYYEDRIVVPALFELEASYKHLDGDNYQITADAEMIQAYEGVNHNIVLQVVITESHIDEAWQGLTELNFACRDIVPDEEGTTMDFEGNPIQSVSLDFTIPSEYNMENIEIIAFLQDYDTKEVLQGTITDLVIGIETIASESQISINPNPATDIVSIVSNYNIEYITVYNFVGQIIQKESVNHTSYRVNTSNFNAGIYLFRIETNEGIISKRVIIE